MHANLLKALLLTGGLALASPVLAAPTASGSYSIHSGVFQGSAQLGPARMAGTVPVASNIRRYANNHLRYNSRYIRRRNDPYANLNQ